METIKQMKENGWVFKYDPDTKFIAADHEKGGAQSICQITIRDNRADHIGNAIVDFLNKYPGM